MKREITLANERVVPFAVSDVVDESLPPIFVFGMRKSGSTLFHKMMIALSRDAQRHPMDVAGNLFEHDILVRDWINDSALMDLFGNGYTYLGFRTPYLPLLDSEVLKNSKVLLLFRDPRDALVSQYFSARKTHKLPASSGNEGEAASLLEKRKKANEQSIDEYCLMNARAFRATLRQFVPFVNLPNSKVFYYEDVILKKERWIKQIAEFCEFEIKGGRVKRIVDGIDKVPETEDPNKFIRKALPGDHKEKLRPDTIEALTLIFEDIAKDLGIKLNRKLS